jgi:hypothetical protein
MHTWKTALTFCAAAQLTLLGCGSDEDTPASMPPVSQQEAGVSQADAAMGVGAPDTGTSVGPSVVDASTPTPRVDAQTPVQPSDAGARDTGTSPPPPPMGDAGPMDGDPQKPVVAIAEVPCRDPAMRGIGLGRANLKVDERDVIIDYPCNKHEGAPMTFILNLHGTTPVEQHFYQWGYFSAYKHVASHNLIIATPSSVVQQWGNGDNGADEPYLLHVVDWVYKTFGTKFDIRQMWVGGHSWGSFYTSRFGCHEMLKDKVKGLILMSGASAPACASRVSILNTAAGMPMPERLLNQASNATAHGCDAMMMRAVDANNDETYWPNCDPGWVHSNYLMKTKMHASSMDPSVVKSLVDWINLARP